MWIQSNNKRKSKDTHSVYPWGCETSVQTMSIQSHRKRKSKETYWVCPWGCKTSVSSMSIQSIIHSKPKDTHSVYPWSLRKPKLKKYSCWYQLVLFIITDLFYITKDKKQSKILPSWSSINKVPESELVTKCSEVVFIYFVQSLYLLIWQETEVAAQELLLAHLLLAVLVLPPGLDQVSCS